ncbi:hypothetical protein OG21DRAFT_1481788 [Imleria badia]|nr:hypothetical protein OG21DRAFT_1481788 [Imleria badia]
MSSFTNNGTFGWGDDRNPSGDYPSTPRQQDAPIIGNSSYNELDWIGEPRQESYVPTGIAPTASSWQSTALFDPRLTVYGGGVWPGDQRLDLGPRFAAPGGNSDGSGTNLPMGVEVAAPALEQAFPFVQRAMLASQHCPPPALNWTQVPGPPTQPSSSWDFPVRTAIQHGGDTTSPVCSLGMRPEIPRFQQAASSVISAHSGRRAMPIGCLPSVATPHSVRPLPHSDPVPVAPSTPRPRGVLSLNATTFQCLWSSGGTRCRALVAGNRRGVSSHLRDEHAFTCDGHMVACAWSQCRMRMQRRNIPRHIVACHLEIKVTCERCGMALSRADANKKHRQACTGQDTSGGGGERGRG